MKVRVKYLDLKPECYYSDGERASSGWFTFEKDGVELEAITYGISYRAELKKGSFYSMELVLIPYVYYRQNLRERMLKKVATHPFYPMYVVMGEVVAIKGERSIERVVVDAGIEVEVECRAFNIDEDEVKKTKKGDYIAAMGVMLGEKLREE